MVMFKEFAIPLGLAASPETNSTSFRLMERSIFDLFLYFFIQTAEKR